ncbi:MAG: acyltransferase [Nanoarchaeota archaeon]|nr:acyltransferase [Nanoarchaeota archaeon]
MGKIYHFKKEILRLLANHAIGNGLRISLLKASGVIVGKKVFTNQGLTIVDNGNKGMVIIEDYVTFAPNVTLITKSAPGHIHPSLTKEDLPLKEEKIRIREGTWIGTNVTILPGVTVGKCCLIGAGSVVTKNIPDYTVVAGVPAKEIRKLK